MLTLLTKRRMGSAVRRALRPVLVLTVPLVMRLRADSALLSVFVSGLLVSVASVVKAREFVGPGFVF